MKVGIGFEAKGDLGVLYGAHRLRVAAWAGIPPSEVNSEDVARYEAAHDVEGHQP